MDRREAILERLKAIGEMIAPTVKRMDFDINDQALPALVVIDGQEGQFGDRPAAHPGDASHYMRMEPQFVVFLQAATDIGTRLNEVRARLVNACCTDETIKSITGHKSGCRYEACENGVQIAEGLVGDMLITFSLVYLLNPREL
ncbi:MAG: hypothetical protein ABFD96_25435 [Armatimonadia bacterium]